MRINVKNQPLCFQNAGITHDDKIKNKFTAYINCAIRRSRNKYIKQKIRRERMTSPITDCTAWEKSSIDCEDLKCIIFCLNEREQKILYEHVLMRRTYLEIAEKLSMTLSAVQKAYQRLIAKLRKEMESVKWASEIL